MCDDEMIEAQFPITQHFNPTSLSFFFFCFVAPLSALTLFEKLYFPSVIMFPTLLQRSRLMDLAGVAGKLKAH